MTEQTIRVVSLEHGGGFYIVPATDVADFYSAMEDYDGVDDVEYKITYKTVSKAYFDSLSEFDGF